MRIAQTQMHRDFAGRTFDGAVERPVIAPIDPETVTAEKYRSTEGTLRDVVAGVDADDLFGGLRRADRPRGGN